MYAKIVLTIVILVLLTLVTAPSVCLRSLTTQHQTLVRVPQMNTKLIQVFAPLARPTVQRAPIGQDFALVVLPLSDPTLRLMVLVHVIPPIKLCSMANVFHCLIATHLVSTIQETTLASTARLPTA